jgi:hypothetical protein
MKAFCTHCQATDHYMSACPKLAAPSRGDPRVETHTLDEPIPRSILRRPLAFGPRPVGVTTSNVAVTPSVATPKPFASAARIMELEAEVKHLKRYAAQLALELSRATSAASPPPPASAAQIPPPARGNEPPTPRHIADTSNVIHPSQPPVSVTNTTHEVSVTPEVSVTAPKKNKGGRPRKADALTPAERARRRREKLKQRTYVKGME